MEIVVHGVIRLAEGYTINGQDVRTAFVVPPALVDIQPDDSGIRAYIDLEDCSVEELKQIKGYLGISSSARTEKGLISAIHRSWGEP